MTRPPSTREATLERRAQLERTALALAFEANAVAELGDPGSMRAERVRAGARVLEGDVNAIAPALDADDKVVAFARLVLRLLPEELERL